MYYSVNLFLGILETVFYCFHKLSEAQCMLYRSIGGVEHIPLSQAPQTASGTPLYHCGKMYLNVPNSFIDSVSSPHLPAEESPKLCMSCTAQSGDIFLPSRFMDGSMFTLHVLSWKMFLKYSSYPYPPSKWDSVHNLTFSASGFCCFYPRWQWHDHW